MVIKASAAGEIRTLVAALAGGDDVGREAAIARLAVIGGRAVDRLVSAYESAVERDARVAILRALEPAADRRAIALARQALSEGGDLAVVAAGVLRGLLNDGQPGVEALDALIATALDARADHRVRVAALDALQDMPSAVRAGVMEALRAEPDTSVKRRLTDVPREAAASEALWSDALEGRLPDDPVPLRSLAGVKGAATPLLSLQRLIDAVRGREGAVGATSRRDEWQSVRGALHQALALRGSTVALYDLRETLTAADGPLPASFLAAIQVLGDQTCLEPIAAALAHAPADNARWRQQLASAFRAIAKRERISRRHAAMKRIVTRFPAAAREIMAAT